MKKYNFNRKEFKWAEEYYDLIKDRMNLPDWFGKNSDALWDMLIGYIETPCEITLVGFDKEKNNYNKENINLINNCFLDAEKKYPNKFKVILKNE